MFISTISGWVLIGALCVSDLSDSFGQKCITFWDSPMVYHKTVDECKESANYKAQQIKNKMDENQLTIISLEITCFDVNPVKADGSIEKSLKMQYNIL